MEKSDYWHFIYILRGKVNHIPANSRHFPTGNVDFTVIFAISSRKVYQISTNLGHFPPMIHTLQGTTGGLHRITAGKPQGK